MESHKQLDALGSLSDDEGSENEEEEEEGEREEEEEEEVEGEREGGGRGEEGVCEEEKPSLLVESLPHKQVSL